jgi:hypothetical protein
MIRVLPGVPDGLRRPGHRADEGAMTVESAFAMLGLVAVVAALAWCLAIIGAQLAVGEAARAAARVAARGELPGAVGDEAHRLVPEAVVQVRVEAGHVVVHLERTVTLPGVFARWGGVDLRADAVALVETPS